MVHALPEGGCMMVGNAYSNDGDLTGALGDSDIVALRLDAEGTILWQHHYGGESTDLVSDVLVLPDGGAVICGRSRSSGGMMSGMHQGQFDILAFRISPEGQTLWARAFGGSQSDHANAVCPHPNGGVVLACKSVSFDGDTEGQIAWHDIWLLHLDGEGELVQEASLGEETGVEGAHAIEYAADIVLTTDGQLVVVGSSTAASTDLGEDGPYNDQYIAKLDANLETLWETFPGGVLEEEAQVAFPLPSGGVITVGYTWSSDFENTDPMEGGFCRGTLVKVNETGGVIWAQTFGGEGIDRIRDIRPGNNGGWFAIGVSDSNTGSFNGNAGQADLWFLQMDGEGNLIHQELMGGSQNDAGTSMAIDQQTGRFYLAGTSSSADGDPSSNAGNSDWWLLGLDVPSAIGEEDRPTYMRFDPRSNALRWAPDAGLSGALSLYNVQGQCVLTARQGWSFVSLEHLPCGHYLASMQTADRAERLSVYVH